MRNSLFTKALEKITTTLYYSVEKSELIAFRDPIDLSSSKLELALESLQVRVPIHPHLQESWL